VARFSLRFRLVATDSPPGIRRSGRSLAGRGATALLALCLFGQSARGEQDWVEDEPRWIPSFRFGFQTFGYGTEATVTHVAEMIEEAPVPTGAPLVVQVSRWDALKDPAGVVRGFVEEPGLADAHLLLAGPADDSVADDPEATNTLREVRDLRRDLPVAERRRVHLANLPTGDVEENASIVNALQRHADVIVQKSLAEGFGLTVTEAMWKARPIVAADVGGIRDQIDDDVQGALVDPRDLTAFGTAVLRLLHDRTLADQLGQAARRRVRERYLAPQYLGAYLELFSELL